MHHLSLWLSPSAYVPDQRRQYGRLISKTCSRGLDISCAAASGTAQARTITTEWHPTLFLPLTVTEPGQVTRYQYDTQGRQLSRTVESL